MRVIAYTMQFCGEMPQHSDLNCIPFEKTYFEEYKTIYNECFHEMREALDIKPYDYLSSFEQIEGKADSIYLLIRNGEIAGSVSCLGNEIDDLIVSPQYRGKGYGRALLLWAAERIMNATGGPVTLHVAEWNENAIRLYKKAGFSIIKTECVRE